MKINLQLPFFYGFYESALENSDTEYWAMKEAKEYCEECDIEWDEESMEFDYKTRRKDIIEGHVLFIKEVLPDFADIVSEAEMVSPRYYNFTTDKLYADFELKGDWRTDMLKFMTEHYDTLKERIKEDWSSYDGFTSFMSNDIDEWKTEIEKSDENIDDRYVSSLIAYMILSKFDWKMDRVYDEAVACALEDIYDESYVIKKQGEEKE